MSNRHISLDVARRQGSELANTLSVLMAKPADGEENLRRSLEILTKVSIHAMVQKGWSERDAIASLAAMIVQILLEGSSDGDSLAVHIQQLARQYNAARPSSSDQREPGDSPTIESHLPDGAKFEAAQQVAEVLDRLYPSPDQENCRYEATKHVIGQVLAVMIIRGVPDPDAIQTIVAAVMEMLADGMGYSGAAEHFRRMADAMEREAPLKQ